MIEFHFVSVSLFLTAVWILARAVTGLARKKISWKRELQLLLVYVCIMVVARMTFFPFSKINGQVQPLVLDVNSPKFFGVNFLPIVYMMDYDSKKELIINLVGNTTMFIPIGVIWPAVYKKLNTPLKVIAAGVGFSLLVEILQLPFDRLSDVDDLILNSAGFMIGYGIYGLVCLVRKKLCKK